MRSTAVIVSAMAIGTSALGINCRGSSECGITGGRTTDINNFVQKIDPNRWYQNGEHIACWQSKLGTGICAFLQGTGGIPGNLIKELVQDIVNHGCHVCGSVPVFFNAGDNNVNSHGQLTINYVEKMGNCNGLC